MSETSKNDALEAEIKRVHRLANANLQAVQDALWGRNYQPSSLTLELNPAAEKVMGHFICNHEGEWQDFGRNAGHGRTLVDLVAYVAGVDRDRAFIALRDLVDRLPTPTPSPMRPIFGGEEIERPAPKVRTVASLAERSLRRG